MDTDLGLSDFWERYQVKEFDESINKAREVLKRAIRSAEDANNRVNSWNKDEQIQRLNHMLEEFRGRTFAFNERDMPMVNEFVLKHQGLNSHLVKQPFHRITYEFTPTEIGTCTSVKCSCGERLDYFN